MAARHDMAIVLFGNLESFKYRHSKHLGKMIRSKVRRLGRMLVIMKNLSKDIDDFASIFNPIHFDIFIKAVNIMGKYDEDSMKFNAPATA